MPDRQAGEVGNAQQELTIYRSAQRYRTDADGITTLHCFAFGDHYDPHNIGFANLIAVNEERLAPGAGYDLHRHSDTEIVTWVLDGALRHDDTLGSGGTIEVGTVQRMSAGAGVEHSERNASSHESLRFVQMWLRGGDADAQPAYAQADIADWLATGEFVAAVGDPSTPPGHPANVEPAVGIAIPGAWLWIARVNGQRTTLPYAPLRHLHVVRGSVRVAGEQLNEGDTLRLTSKANGGAGQHRLELESDAASEVLLWAMHPAS